MWQVSSEGKNEMVEIFGEGAADPGVGGVTGGVGKVILGKKSWIIIHGMACEGKDLKSEVLVGAVVDLLGDEET